MREIKFRAWDHQNNSMFYPHEIYFDEGLKNIRALDTMANYTENGRPRFVLMQYTGLKDRNGKEIYEGDLLSWGEYLLVCKWEQGDCRYSLYNTKNNIWVEYLDEYITHEIRVIGSVYENPELLKKGGNTECGIN